MSSQLFSVGSVGASVSGQALVATGEGAPKTLMDVFASLLSHAGGEVGTDPTITQASTASLELKGVARGLIASLLGGANATATEGDVPGEPVGEAEASPLAGLADLLGKIEAALEAGGSVDPELLKKLSEASDALAGAIGGLGIIEADTLLGGGAVIEVAAATEVDMIPGVTPDNADDPVHPMLQGLADRLKALGDSLAPSDPDLSAKIAALAETLSTVRTTIADLVKEAPELKTMIGELMRLRVDAKGEAAATPAAPVLAAPELRLPETTSLSANKAADKVRNPSAPATEGSPSDGEAVDGPKVQVRADVSVKADQVPAPSAFPDRREPAVLSSQMSAPSTPDPTAPGTLAPPTSENGTLRAIHTAYQAPPPINLPHMAVEIARHVQQGISKFQIRLDPPELGRIDVKLDMDQSGQVNARLTVERSETLDLLQRDQRSLERALAQAGLDTNKTNLEFSLKQNPFAGQDGKGGDQTGSPFGDARALVAEAEPTAVATVYRGTASAAGLNIFV